MSIILTSFQKRPLPGWPLTARSCAASSFCRRRSSAISPAGSGGFGGGPCAVIGSAMAGAGAEEWRCRHWKAHAAAEGTRRARARARVWVGSRRGTSRRDIWIALCGAVCGMWYVRVADLGSGGGAIWMEEVRTPRRRDHRLSLGCEKSLRKQKKVISLFIHSCTHPHRNGTF